MPNTNDPLLTTDHDPSDASPNRDFTTDFTSGLPADDATATHLPGQNADAIRTYLERAPASVLVPGYEIESVLGRGGMGVVYKARHLSLKRTVALKMVLAGGHAGPHELARFRIEAEAVARLQHPNIVQIHEVGVADGHAYCALEFVEGGTLAGKLAGKPMPAAEAAKLVETLARAMQLAHSRNVVHRDLKPANILLAADGTPKITDFGLARQMDSDSGETQAGAVMGTPSYMAPEQASGNAHEAGPAADVYALGAILYDCLAGQPPFKGKTVIETLDQVRTQDPAPPSRCQASVPLDLDTICLKCLRKEPEKRYASAAELADELVRYQQGEPILARPVGRLERALKWVKRNPVMAAAVAAVFMLMLLVSITATVFAVQMKLKNEAIKAERTKAEQKAIEAETNRQLADQKAIEAETNRQLADQRYDLALESLTLTSNRLPQQLSLLPGSQLVREHILEQFAKMMEKTLTEKDSSGLTGRAEMTARVGLGDLYKAQGKLPEAAAQFRQAQDIGKRLFDENPTSDKAKGNYAFTIVKSAEITLARAGKWPEAISEYNRALLLQEEKVYHPNSAEIPEFEARRSVAGTYDLLADAHHQLKQPVQARQYALKAIEERLAVVRLNPSESARDELAEAYSNNGKLLLALRDRLAAIRSYEQAAAIHEELLKAAPPRPWHMKKAILEHAAAGDELLHVNEPMKARDHYIRLLDLNKQYLKFDSTQVILNTLALSYYRLATAEWWVDGWEAAQKNYRECLKMAKDRAEKNPNNPSAKILLMNTLARCGEHIQAAAIAEEVRKIAPNDAGMLEQIGCCYSLCGPAVAQGRVESKLTPAERELQVQYHAKAMQAIARAIELGYSDLDTLRVDPDLKPMQADPEYSKLLEKLELPR